MDNRIGLALVFAACPLFMAGCSTDMSEMFIQQEGVEVSRAKYNSFELGRTPSSVIRAALGEPSRKTKKAGHELWVYNFKRYSSNPLAIDDTRSQSTVFDFDSKGILQKRWQHDFKDNN
jgi:uncharacterized protein YceK